MAIYVILVIRTIREIAYFTIMFLGCIFTFANAIYILNRQRLSEIAQAEIEIAPTNVTESEPAEDEIGPLYDDAVGNGVINAILAEFRIGFAMFENDKYTDVPNLVWIYFLLATLITQVIFLNMIINLMGVTFTDVDENTNRLLLQ